MKSVKPSTVRRSTRMQASKDPGGKRAALLEPEPSLKKIRSESDDPTLPPILTEEEIVLRTTLTQPCLAFSLEDAREHLCRCDSRFIRMFMQMELKTYDELKDGQVKELNLFRVLTTSIIGQQISWVAARSVNYKFCRIFAPELPVQPDWDHVVRDALPFPTPRQLLAVSDEQLRQAGLSAAKMKYVRDVARRFADGRLDVRRIVNMGPEACIAELTQVKGVGRWTAEMLLMFALRSPDILPVGDLGVQRGIVRFYLTDAAGPMITERKRRPNYVHEPSDEAGLLPDGALSIQELATRTHTKTKKGMYLDADEMEALARPWAPYRSVACMFMWSVEGR